MFLIQFDEIIQLITLKFERLCGRRKADSILKLKDLKESDIIWSCSYSYGLFTDNLCFLISLIWICFLSPLNPAVCGWFISCFCHYGNAWAYGSEIQLHNYLLEHEIMCLASHRLGSSGSFYPFHCRSWNNSLLRF